jgi:hypothetical protein
MCVIALVSARFFSLKLVFTADVAEFAVTEKDPNVKQSATSVQSQPSEQPITTREFCISRLVFFFEKKKKKKKKKPLQQL